MMAKISSEEKVDPKAEKIKAKITPKWTAGPKTTRYTHGVLGIDNIEPGIKLDKVHENHDNPVEVQLKKEMKGTIHGRMQDSIERFRKFRQSMNDQNQGSNNKLIDDQLEFLKNPT